MNMSKEKRKEVLIRNFEIIKDNFEKNGLEFAPTIGKMIEIDKETAIDMWLFLLKKHECKIKGYNSCLITTRISYYIEKAIGETATDQIILENPEIKKAYFALMHQHVALSCGGIIRRKITENELMTANELIELVYSNPNREDSWYKIMEDTLPWSDRWKANEEAIELLEMWCDKIEDEEERAKLSLKMLEYYKIVESKHNETYVQRNDSSESLTVEDNNYSINTSLSNDEIISMYPTTDEDKEYILSLLEDVDLYITFPKPKGKISASKTNQMSAKIMDSFAILEKIGRLDVVSHILTKFVAVKDVLEPVDYFTWIRLGSRQLSNEALYKVYLMNKPAFEAWLESNQNFEHAILDVAKKIGAVCTESEFTEFKNIVERKFGNVRNIDYYFKRQHNT